MFRAEHQRKGLGFFVYLFLAKHSKNNLLSFPPSSSLSSRRSQEIGDVLRAVGQYPTKDEEKKLLKDHTDGKVVSSKQFYAMVKAHQSANENWEDELREAFNHFDEDGSGTIDTKEIVHAMTKIGQKLTEKQAQEFVREADVDGDGEIDYNEFVAMLTSGRKGK